MNTQLSIVDYHSNPINYTPLETVEKPLWWQLRGLSYTSTGYGPKIPTSYMVKHNNRMKRVYCRIYSNSGSLFIINGKGTLPLTDS
jgi:hypothetical protein